MAKPVAVDAAGTLEIGRWARNPRRTAAFLVDFQVPTDPFNIEVMKRLKAEARSAACR